MANTAAPRHTFLVFGGTGGTGKHFIEQVLADGHSVRALARTPAKLPQAEKLSVTAGSITDHSVDLDRLVEGVDYVVAMLGDKAAQAKERICLPFVQRLVPAMRRHGVKRFLYQAGGLSKPYNGSLGPILWILRNTLASGFDGQHRDNEAVMEYLETQARDIEWIVHRAGISGDGPSKGTLERAQTWGIGTFKDCATYNYKTVSDGAAVHTSDLSAYTK